MSNETTSDASAATLDFVEAARQLNEQVLTPMKQTFVGKDEVIDLLGVCLIARENLFILGPPGTAKSALVQAMARRLQGSLFDYLLTQFTEPNEIFGPFDIRQLRDGNLVTNTEGMLPEATFVFLDELLNANSAILNSLLMVLNERVFRRGRETRSLPTLLVVGASNRLPEDDALQALFDRFPVRVQCDNVAEEDLQKVLRAGWELDAKCNDSLQLADENQSTSSLLTVSAMAELQQSISQADLSPVLSEFATLIQRLRKAGLEISDRRAVKLQRLVAASAFLCGRTVVDVTDFWVLRYVWDALEQQTVVEAIVQAAIDEHKTTSVESARAVHPQAKDNAIDAEQLARDLESLQTNLAAAQDAEALLKLHDQLSILARQCAWVVDDQQRSFLQEQISKTWEAYPAST